MPLFFSQCQLCGRGKGDRWKSGKLHLRSVGVAVASRRSCNRDFPTCASRRREKLFSRRGEAVLPIRRTASLPPGNGFSRLGRVSRRAARRGRFGLLGVESGARGGGSRAPLGGDACAEMPRFAPFRRDSEVFPDFSRFPLARRAADVVYYAPVRPERRTRSLKVGS